MNVNRNSDSRVDQTNSDRNTLSSDRMDIFRKRERDFMEFVAETESIDNVDEEPDQPLMGLQCLLTLADILERAVRLRKINSDLEQRIEELDHVKLVSEVIINLPMSY